MVCQDLLVLADCRRSGLVRGGKVAMALALRPLDVLERLVGASIARLVTIDPGSLIKLTDARSALQWWTLRLGSAASRPSSAST